MAIVRVLPDRGFWVVSVEGRAEPETVERTRRLADKAARPLGARLVIHRLDGGTSFELQYDRDRTNAETGREVSADVDKS